MYVAQYIHIRKLLYARARATLGGRNIAMREQQRLCIRPMRKEKMQGSTTAGQSALRVRFFLLLDRKHFLIYHFFTPPSSLPTVLTPQNGVLRLLIHPYRLQTLHYVIDNKKKNNVEYSEWESEYRTDERFSSFSGLRQEQDIFVRLIDSSTKQVRIFIF